MTRKVALCVGINDYAPATKIPSLRGCVNDALLVGEMLRHAGFEVRQVHNQAATQAGILARLERDVARLRAGDYFVFWNSSHGYQLVDRSGDELHDGLDEAVCTYDTDVRAPLSDDKLASVFSRANRKATVFLGSDSCHSGTLTRSSADALRRNSPDKDYRAPRLWLPPEDIRFRTGQIDFDMWSLVEDQPASKDRLEPSESKPRHFGRLGHPPPEVPNLLLAACRSDQVCWDAYLGTQFHGAMTFNFAKVVLSAWKMGKAISYREAHRAMAEAVRAEFDQDPQLEGTADFADEPVFGFVPI